jgi:hypothetical protein
MWGDDDYGLNLADEIKRLTDTCSLLKDADSVLQLPSRSLQP